MGIASVRDQSKRQQYRSQSQSQLQQNRSQSQSQRQRLLSRSILELVLPQSELPRPIAERRQMNLNSSTRSFWPVPCTNGQRVASFLIKDSGSILRTPLCHVGNRIRIAS